METTSTMTLLGVVVAMVGCHDPRRDEQDSLATSPSAISADGDDGDDGGRTAGDDDSDGDSTASGSEGSAPELDGTDGGPKLDVGVGGTSGDHGEDAGDADGCDKVDFLFVIDNSGSMGDEQANLKASFPQFIDTIREDLDEAQDFHILVTDVDEYAYELCDTACACNDAEGVCEPMTAPGCDIACALAAFPCLLEPNYTCGVTMPLECEDVLGAGVIHPRGSGASNVDCNFSSGARYIDSTEPDLTAALSCAAGVGTGGGSPTERPMEAMVHAVSPNTDAAACNAGWIRDDAILVVTFITDEDDGSSDSAGTVAGWRQALIAAKGGDETAVVVLGLFGDNDMPGAICHTPNQNDNSGAESAPRLRAFINSWGDHGFFGSVCAPSYDEFFTEAVGIIDTTCEDFNPPQG